MFLFSLLCFGKKITLHTTRLLGTFFRSTVCRHWPLLFHIIQFYFSLLVYDMKYHLLIFNLFVSTDYNSRLLYTIDYYVHGIVMFVKL